MGALFNPSLDDTLLFERVESFRGGMNSYLRPSLLEADTSAILQNVLVDTDHLARTRPGTTVLGGEKLAAAIIQGAAYFDTPSTELLVAACNKALNRWNGTAWAAIAGYTATSATSQIEMAQGNNLLFISDGSIGWYSYDGTTLTALGTVSGTIGSDPPAACSIMCWHTSRMFAAGSSAEPDAIWASDILDAGQGHWDHTQFKFRVGGGEGEAITLLASLQDYWLLVGKSNSLWLVYTDPTKATAADWPVTNLTRHAGAVGKRAFANYGNDLLVVTTDGLYSVRRMQTSGQAYEVVPPVSEPLQPEISRIDWQYAGTSCATRYKHFGLFALPLDLAQVPDTVLVYNFRTGSWCGKWTGWAPMTFAVTRFNDVQQLTFGDSAGRLHRWRDADSDSLLVYTDAGNDAAAAAPIETVVRTRSFLFGDAVSNKDGEYFEARFIESDGTVEVALLADDQEERAWSASTQPVWNQLPVDLPFDLASNRPATVRESLIGIEPWNEAALEIRMDSGWYKLKNATLGAFLNTVENE